LSLFSGSFKLEVVRNNPSGRRNWLALSTNFLSSLVMIAVVQFYDHGFVSWNRKAIPSPTELFDSAYSAAGSCYIFAAARTGCPWRCKPLPRTGQGMLKMWPCQSEIFLWRWLRRATTPPRKHKVWWWNNYQKVLLFPSPLFWIKLYFAF
jgi:hypothetical protein